MKVYNKLVRDKIPEIIEQDGKSCQTRILDDEEYLVALKQKLIEEANELLHAPTMEKTIEELADIYEVLHFVMKTENIKMPDIEAIRIHKNRDRGAFQKKVFLTSVDE